MSNGFISASSIETMYKTQRINMESDRLSTTITPKQIDMPLASGIVKRSVCEWITAKKNHTTKDLTALDDL